MGSALAYAPTMAPVSTVTRAATPQMMDLAGLKDQAKQLNPVVGFFDPLNLSEGEFWGDSNAATIGFLRESEIKHGRIAMFGFVGYIVHANGIHWPTKGPWDNIPTDISPQEMWDLTPEAAKWQIILTIAFLEFWRENAYVLKADGEAHYMRGGKPGYFPTFDQLPHPVPFNLYDPFKISKNKTPELPRRDAAAGLCAWPDRARPQGLLGQHHGAFRLQLPHLWPVDSHLPAVLQVGCAPAGG